MGILFFLRQHPLTASKYAAEPRLRICAFSCKMELYFFNFRSSAERFDLLSHNCLSDFGDNTSMHGPKWYNLKPNYFCRVLLAIFIVTFLISFPIIFYSALHAAFTSNSVTTTIETQKAVDMKYPNLTVCFAKFFDKQRLDGKSIPIPLLNMY